MTLAEAPRILQPGLMLLAPGVERYRVVGGGATIVAVSAGDELVITDPQGMQPCELSVFDSAGVPNGGLLGDGHATRPAESTQRILSARIHDARRVRQGLKMAGVDLAAAMAIDVFQPESPAGASRRFVAHDEAICVLAAPGGERSILPEVGGFLLPQPLADPSQDFRVDRGTATAFEVPAGSFIQVVDIEGRECSDFQAFDARKLQHDVERALDATTTRSLMGASYPGPGLYSKFYDVDMQPMLEVIQDTVGRHDTFNLACTAKYYEDMGYPGHVNCTDNINGAVEPYNVAPRRGWEAINFFYNTNIDGANQICATSMRRTDGTRPTSRSASTRKRTSSRKPPPSA